MYKIIGGDGKEYGPVSAEDLRRWIAEGRVNAQTRVQAEGSADWQPLGSIAEFGLPAFATALPTPLPRTATAPTFIKVFSILNMIFGGLGLLCTPMNFIGIPLAAKTLGNSPMMLGYMIFSSVWGFIGACVLLASGIGLWKLKAWARKLAVWYSVLAIVLGVVGAFVLASAFGQMGGGNEMERAQRIGGIIGGVVGSLVGLVYNVLLIVFLVRPAAKRATGEIE
jgi:uncharacterized membrane protein YeaQ/YmgE (transglycosylase-associated protein family)